MAYEADETLIPVTLSIYTADVGATFPISPTSTPSSTQWYHLGYITEDGIELSGDAETFKLYGLQALLALKENVVKREQSITLTGLQHNRYTKILSRGGGSWTSPSAGVYKFVEPASGGPVLEKALIIDITDGDKTYRRCWSRVSVPGSTTSTISKGDAFGLPVTFNLLEPLSGDAAWELTDDTNADAAEAAS